MVIRVCQRQICDDFIMLFKEIWFCGEGGGGPRSTHVRPIQYIYMGTMIGFHHLGSKKIY